MRILFKILAAPVVGALTLAVAVLTFLHSIAGLFLNALCGLLVLCALFSWFVGGNTESGVRWLIFGFFLSPVGLPAVVGWLIERLDDLNYSLRGFIVG